MRLLRDGYHNDVSPFPAAFIERQGRTLLVHSPAWNRLDVSDPRSDELLTARTYGPKLPGKPYSAHYLDYFHGRLLPSPDGRFIADDGWIWAPVGRIRTWDVWDWLEKNPWESEDGSSARYIAYRWYYWVGPMCWLDETTLAVWGYGEDDAWLLPAVCLYDVVSGKRRSWFPGPEIASLTKASRRATLGALIGNRLFFDRYLFAVSEKFGVGVWDVAEGARLHQDASFAPVAYHPGTREFLTLLPDGAMQLSRLIDGED